MNKIIKKACLLFTALVSLSVGTNYTVNEVKAAEVTIPAVNLGKPTEDEITAQEANYTIGEVNMIWVKGSSNTSIASYSPIRVYVGHEVTFTVNSSVKELKTIAITIAEKDTAINGWTGGTAVNADGITTITCTSNEVKFVSAAQTRWSAISVTYTLDDSITPLNAPTNVSLVNRTISWDAVENADFYNVSILDSGNNVVDAFENIPTTSVDLDYTKLVDGDTYTISVVAISTNESFSNSEPGITEPFVFNYTTEEKISVLETKTQLDLRYTCSSGETVEKDETLKSTGSTYYMNDSTVDCSDKVSLGSAFNVYGDKGNASNTIYVSATDIRMYALATGSTETYANKITIECSYEVTSIEFTSVNSGHSVSDIDILVEGTPVANDGTGLFEVNAKTFVIANKKAFRFKSAVISYDEIQTTYSDFKNVNLRYNATIPAELVSEVASYGINVTVGENSKDFTIETVTTLDNGDVNFALVIKNITDYSSVITATAYVVLNDTTKVELIEKSYSVLGMVDYYLENVDLTNDQYLALNAFKAA